MVFYKYRIDYNNLLNEKDALYLMLKEYISYFWDSDFGQKYTFFSGFLVVVWPNQGVQLKDRLF